MILLLTQAVASKSRSLLKAVASVLALCSADDVAFQMTRWDASRITMTCT